MGDKDVDMAVGIVSDEDVAWHAFPSIEALYTELETSEKGLTSAEAESRIALYGKNSLTPPKKPGELGVAVLVLEGHTESFS